MKTLITYILLVSFFSCKSQTTKSQEQTNALNDSVLTAITTDIPILKQYQWTINSGYLNDMEASFGIGSNVGDTLIDVEVFSFDRKKFKIETFHKTMKLNGQTYVLGLSENLDSLYLYYSSSNYEKTFLLGEDYYKKTFNAPLDKIDDYKEK